MNEYVLTKRNKEMKQLVLVYFSLIIFTVVSFLLVYLESSNSVLFIFLLACVQACFQLIYFMHMKEEGHRFPAIMLISAIFVSSIMLAGILSFM